MTIIAAMAFPDYILFGSDSRQTEEGLVSTTNKLRHITACQTLVWGGSGESGILDTYEQWVNNQPADLFADWETLHKVASKELNRINKAWRRSIREAGSRPQKDDLGNALFVGYLDGEPELLEITDKGEWYFHLKKGFAAVGSGEAHFKIAKVTLEAIFQEFSKNEINYSDIYFMFLVAIAARTDPQSGSPLNFAKITPKGVETGGKERRRGRRGAKAEVSKAGLT
jgi:20S proteasome alpha/beta subunit